MSKILFQIFLFISLLTFILSYQLKHNDRNSSKLSEDIYVPCDLKTGQRKHQKDRQNLCKVECYTAEKNPGICQIHALNPCKTLDINVEPIRCPQSSGQSSLFPKICCPFKAVKEEIKPLNTTQRPLTTTEQVIKPETTTEPNIIDNIIPGVNQEDCGERPDIQAIVGGIDAQPNTWPWAVAIYERSSNGARFICGAAIISKNYILSAAHCFVRTDGEKIPAKRYQFKVGAHKLSDKNIKLLDIQEIIVHQNYKTYRNYYDIALIKVRNKIEFNPTVGPICLPKAEMFKEQNFVDRPSKLIGWGATRYGGSVSDTLQEVEVKIVDKKVCNKNYSQIPGLQSGFPQGINEQHICAGLPKGGKDTCQGDSGGPLAVEVQGRWFELGVVSFGYKCAEPGFPGIYTNVKHFLDWIQTYVK